MLGRVPAPELQGLQAFDLLPFCILVERLVSNAREGNPTTIAQPLCKTAGLSLSSGSTEYDGDLNLL